MTHTFSEDACSGKVVSKDNYTVYIHVKINERVPSQKVFYIAASPTEHRTSYSGSGLPFVSPTQAFENTPNQGIIDIDSNNEFQVVLRTPNSYYAGLGSQYIPPTLYLSYNNGFVNKLVSIKLSHGIPYRTLTYVSHPVPRSSPSFYEGLQSLPVRTQEQILKDSAYPAKNVMHSNFWGLKPPL